MKRRVVSRRVVKANWDCPYCNTTKIDGLIDYCPNCGAHKPEKTKYNLDLNNIVEVTKEEAQQAGIKIENCDGNHPDWVCEYCNSLNNYLDEYCSSCGSPKNESKNDYFTMQYEEFENHTDEKNSNINHYEPTPELDGNNDTTKKSKNFFNYILKNNWNKEKFNLYLDWPKIFTISGIGILIALIIFLLFPYDVKTEVNGFSWERTINIEEETTFYENGWTVPAGARVYDQAEELYEIIPVIDHYEQVEVEKVRSVFSHNEYQYEYNYIDNGDGTYTEEIIEIEIPIYVDEIYYEIEEEPVYRDEYIYKTKYYYEIDRWVIIYSSISSGNDKNPYWNFDYTLYTKQRDTNRNEDYIIHYDNGDEKHSSYAEWNNTEIGDCVMITKCRLGIVYKQTSCN